jgi:hypothetical protein
MKKPKRSRVNLDKFLKSAEAAHRQRHKRCMTCEHEEVTDLIQRFMEKKRKSETRVSLSFFHDECLAKVPGFSVTYSGVLKHVNGCLKTDPQTGEPRR